MKTLIASIITICLAFSFNSAKSQTAFHKGNAKNIKTMEVKKCDAYKHNRSAEHKSLVKTHSFCNGNVRDINASRHEIDRKKIKNAKKRSK